MNEMCIELYIYVNTLNSYRDAFVQIWAKDLWQKLKRAMTGHASHVNRNKLLKPELYVKHFTNLHKKKSGKL